MADASTIQSKYDGAAPGWADKMRLLGYFDAYLGFLSAPSFRAAPGARVLDIGCGTGAFAEAWVAIQGPEQEVVVLDPSAEMLARATTALARRGVAVHPVQTMLDAYRPPMRFDSVLVAHVLEHCADPAATLRQMRDLADPGALLWLVVSKPHWCNAIIWFQWRHRAYRPSEVADLLAQSGWALDMEYAFPAGPPSRTSRGYLARAI